MEKEFGFEKLLVYQKSKEYVLGSLMETYSQMDIAKDLNYIDEVELMQVKEQCLVVLKLLAGLKKSYDSAQEKQIADN